APPADRATGRSGRPAPPTRPHRRPPRHRRRGAPQARAWSGRGPCLRFFTRAGREGSCSSARRWWTWAKPAFIPAVAAFSEDRPRVTDTDALPERESMEYDVVVVGGGPAGLGAAIRVKQI